MFRLKGRGKEGSAVLHRSGNGHSSLLRRVTQNSEIAQLHFEQMTLRTSHLQLGKIYIWLQTTPQIQIPGRVKSMATEFCPPDVLLLQYVPSNIEYVLNANPFTAERSKRGGRVQSLMIPWRGSIIVVLVVENCTFCHTANVALLRPAVQISTYRNEVASLAVDNNLATHSCTQYSSQPWWSVDLDRPMDVGRVCVTNDENQYYGQLSTLSSCSGGYSH